GPRRLRSDRERDEARADGRARAARRSSGPALAVPRVAAGPLQRRARVAIAATAGELDHRELRGEHRARTPKTRDDGRVLVEDLVAVGRRAPRRWGAARGEKILRAV